MSRSGSAFKISHVTIEGGDGFSEARLVDRFDPEPDQPASFWKSVAVSASKRLDGLKERNRDNHAKMVRLEKENDQLRRKNERLETHVRLLETLGTEGPPTSESDTPETP